MVLAVLKWAGFDIGNATYTDNMREELCKHGWQALPADLSQAQVGDILLNEACHTCMVVAWSGTSALIAQASIDENGRAHGSQAGDQTGYETNVSRIYTYSRGWDCILRYAGEQAAEEPSPTPTDEAAGRPGLDVDGYWGSATTCALQARLGTYRDGEAWHQLAANVEAQPALTSGWKCDETLLGSPMVAVLQRLLGAKADGLMGPETVRALQARMGTPVDGVLDEASPCVMEMQRRLNRGEL